MSSYYRLWSNKIKCDTVFPARVESAYGGARPVEVPGIDCRSVAMAL